MATKRRPQKAVAQPTTPTTPEEPTSEPTPVEAVAEEAPVQAEAPADPAPAAPAAEGPLVCVSCGKRAVYETDGRATSKVAYCRRDLPANVTKAMVDEYALLSRQ